jgi:predicted nucleotidyltransferase
MWSLLVKLPDKTSALEARKKLIEILPPKKGRHIFVKSTDGLVECKVYEVLNISPEAITELEVKILSICRELGGTEVFWEFETTNAEI